MSFEKKRSTGICWLMSWVQFQREILHKNVHVMSTANKKLKNLMKNKYHVIIFIEAFNNVHKNSSI